VRLCWGEWMPCLAAIRAGSDAGLDRYGARCLQVRLSSVPSGGQDLANFSAGLLAGRVSAGIAEVCSTDVAGGTDAAGFWSINRPGNATAVGGNGEPFAAS